MQPPYFVATKMSKIRRASLTVPYPKAWVAAAMRHIGYETSACVFPVHATMTCVEGLGAKRELHTLLTRSLTLLCAAGASRRCCQPRSSPRSG